MSRFEHPRGNLVTGAGPLRRVGEDQRRFPQAIAVTELIDAAGQHRATLLPQLLNCWMNGMLELYVDPPAVPAKPASDKPRASRGRALPRVAGPVPDQPAAREHSRRCDAATFHSASRWHAHARPARDRNGHGEGEHRQADSVFAECRAARGVGVRRCRLGAVWVGSAPTATAPTSRRTSAACLHGWCRSRARRSHPHC